MCLHQPVVLCGSMSTSRSQPRSKHQGHGVYVDAERLRAQSMRWEYARLTGTRKIAGILNRVPRAVRVRLAKVRPTPAPENPAHDLQCPPIPVTQRRLETPVVGKLEPPPTPVKKRCSTHALYDRQREESPTPAQHVKRSGEGPIPRGPTSAEARLYREYPAPAGEELVAVVARLAQSLGTGDGQPEVDPEVAEFEALSLRINQPPASDGPRCTARSAGQKPSSHQLQLSHRWPFCPLQVAISDPSGPRAPRLQDLGHPDGLFPGVSDFW
ncbi:hypothetical protein C7212DRAFT_346455 [Tuber magnatum]|uniref:Uncharacterized protein n=1 Tax=Tuber magnatum TaxID=42249 RepID=A0A317SIW4_9PEZI|nr:hypothetical protein C7212DRAFT_346455 [Tuber magnatum]